VIARSASRKLIPILRGRRTGAWISLAAMPAGDDETPAGVMLLPQRHTREYGYPVRHGLLGSILQRWKIGDRGASRHPPPPTTVHTGPYTAVSMDQSWSVFHAVPERQNSGVPFATLRSFRAAHSGLHPFSSTAKAVTWIFGRMPVEVSTSKCPCPSVLFHRFRPFGGDSFRLTMLSADFWRRVGCLTADLSPD